MVKVFMFVLLSVALASGDLCGMETPSEKKMFFYGILTCLSNHKDPELRDEAFKALKSKIAENKVPKEIESDIIRAVISLTMRNDERAQQIAYELFIALLAKDTECKALCGAEDAACFLIFAEENFYLQKILAKHGFCLEQRSMKVKAYGFKIFAEVIKSGAFIQPATDAAKYGMDHPDEDMQKGGRLLWRQLNKQMKNELAKL